MRLLLLLLNIGDYRGEVLGTSLLHFVGVFSIFEARGLAEFVSVVCESVRSLGRKQNSIGFSEGFLFFLNSFFLN